MEWLFRSAAPSEFACRRSIDSSKEPHAMDALLTGLEQLVEGLWMILVALGTLLLPWTPLGAWIVFWTFAVDWVKLREVLLRGGWVGVLLIGVVMILVWGAVAPPSEGSHFLFGLTLSNFVGKTVYVTSLFVIMFLCGAVQLAGCCASCCRFEQPSEGP